MKRSLLCGLLICVLIATLIVATKTNAVSSVFAVITCTTTAACAGGNNTGTGPGVTGQSRASHGVIGESTFNSTSSSNGESAVFGEDLSTSGVYDMGVQGTSVRGYGVRGRSSSNAAIRGDSTSLYGLEGTSSTSDGVLGIGNNTSGVYGIGADGSYGQGTQYGAVGEGTDAGVFAYSGSGYGVDAYSGSDIALYGVSTSGAGADVTGHTYGAVARSTSYPLVLTGTGNNTVFYVDASGNVYYAGSITHFSFVHGGTTVTSNTQATSPAVEETGTAHLTMGSASVYLSPSFSRSINPRYGYQVFLTPGGDTRGLYVAGKYTGGFTVREVQGGRGSFSFDYHVYAQTEPSAGAATAAAVPQPPVQRTQVLPRTPQVRLP